MRKIKVLGNVRTGAGWLVTLQSWDDCICTAVTDTVAVDVENVISAINEAKNKIRLKYEKENRS